MIQECWVSLADIMQSVFRISQWLSHCFFLMPVINNKSWLDRTNPCRSTTFTVNIVILCRHVGLLPHDSFRVNQRLIWCLALLSVSSVMVWKRTWMSTTRWHEDSTAWSSALTSGYELRIGHWLVNWLWRRAAWDKMTLHKSSRRFNMDRKDWKELSLILLC